MITQWIRVKFSIASSGEGMFVPLNLTPSVTSFARSIDFYQTQCLTKWIVCKHFINSCIRPSKSFFHFTIWDDLTGNRLKRTCNQKPNHQWYTKFKFDTMPIVRLHVVDQSGVLGVWFLKPWHHQLDFASIMEESLWVGHRFVDTNFPMVQPLSSTWLPIWRYPPLLPISRPSIGLRQPKLAASNSLHLATRDSHWRCHRDKMNPVKYSLLNWGHCQDLTLTPPQYSVSSMRMAFSLNAISRVNGSCGSP